MLGPGPKGGGEGGSREREGVCVCAIGRKGEREMEKSTAGKPSLPVSGGTGRGVCCRRLVGGFWMG